MTALKDQVLAALTGPMTTSEVREAVPSSSHGEAYRALTGLVRSGQVQRTPYLPRETVLWWRSG